LCLKITVLCLTLAVHRSVQEAHLASNVGSVKYVEGLNCLQTEWEAWGSYGLGMVTALKKKQQKTVRDICIGIINSILCSEVCNYKISHLGMNAFTNNTYVVGEEELVLEDSAAWVAGIPRQFHSY